MIINKLEKLFLSLFIFIIIIALGSCNNENPVGPNLSSPFLYGQVVDNQGNPIDGVNFNYIPNLVHRSLPKSRLNKVNSSVRINFTIPRKTFVNLSVYRLYTKSLILTLVNDTLSAGSHSVAFNDSSITDGVYYYRLKMDTTVLTKYILIIKDTALLPLTKPLAVTNSSGQFSEPIGVFGIGMRFLISSTLGPTPADTVYLSNTIQAVLSKSGYKTLIQPITIDTTKSFNKRFVLEK